MEARSFTAREREKEERRRRHATRGQDGASDGKTVIVSESEDNYSDRGLHKRERSFSCECGGGNKRVRESGRERGGDGKGRIDIAEREGRR